MRRRTRLNKPVTPGSAIPYITSVDDNPLDGQLQLPVIIRARAATMLFHHLVNRAHG